MYLFWCYCVISCLSEKGVVFGAPLTEEGIAQIYQLIEYLSRSEYDFIKVLQVDFIVRMSEKKSLFMTICYHT